MLWTPTLYMAPPVWYSPVGIVWYLVEESIEGGFLDPKISTSRGVLGVKEVWKIKSSRTFLYGW